MSPCLHMHLLLKPQHSKLDCSACALDVLLTQQYLHNHVHTTNLKIESCLDGLTERYVRTTTEAAVSYALTDM